MLDVLRHRLQRRRAGVTLRDVNPELARNTAVEAVPPPRAPGEDLRSAYLDLLKRSLCDLLWPIVETVEQQPGEEPRVSELGTGQLYRRLEGNDWPLRGLTMVGLKRLDDLEACIGDLIASEVPGDLIEAGVWRGGAAIFMRAALLAYGAPQREVWLADSFRGLPDPDPENYPADGESEWRWHERSYLEVPADEVRANFERYGLLDDRVRFLEGWFADTLPTVRDRTWALIRLDGDMYESTWVGLESLYPGLAPGGYVIIDDYHDVVECRRAVDDFRRAHRILDQLTDVDGHCIRWRRSR
jgi:O-methyltransferase